MPTSGLRRSGMAQLNVDVIRGKMTVTYDHKFRGLLVEIDEQTMKNLAEELCRTTNTQELLNKQIDHITYIDRNANQKSKKDSTITVPIIAYWLAMGVLLCLGMYQLGEILIDIIY